MDEAPVITVAHTIMDGTVVRWHRSLADARNQRPLCSASRNGVTINGAYLTDIPDERIEEAKVAWLELSRRRDADMSHLATHRPRDGFAGPLEPVGAREER